MSDPGQSPRAIQIALLGIVAATVILADKTEAERRIDSAITAVQSWPHEVAALREQLRRSQGYDDVVFDWPDRLSLGWFADHQRGCSVFVRGYRVARDCEYVRKLYLLVDSDCDNPRFHVVRVVADAPNYSALRLALDDDKTQRQAENKLDSSEKNLENKKEMSRSQEREFGTNGASANRARNALSEASKERDKAQREVEKAKKQRTASIDELKKTSDAARGAKSQPGSSQILLVADRAAFYFIASFPAKEAGECRTPCLDRGPPSSDTVPDPAECVQAIDVELLPLTTPTAACAATQAPAGDASVSAASIPGVPDGGASTQPPARDASSGSRWDIDSLVKAGVWKDIRDLDVASALALLEDRKTQAELEGEIFGLKVRSADAVRWAWLPIVVLEFYALLLLYRPRRRPDADKDESSGDIWNGRWWQWIVASYAAAGFALSIHRGAAGANELRFAGHGPFTHYWLVLVGLLVLFILGVFLAWIAGIVLRTIRGRAPTNAGQPDGPDGLGPSS